jgi:large subunit ribosomal protein L29
VFGEFGAMKSKDILVSLRAMGTDELQKKAIETAEERMRLKFKASLGQLEGSHQFGDARRMLARLKTVIREKVNTAV